MTQNVKQKSREYFNSHRKSRLAHGGYWRHDYRCQLEAIGRIMPDRLIDIGCGPGAFLSLVKETFPDIQLNALAQDITPVLDFGESIYKDPKLKEGVLALGNSDLFGLGSIQKTEKKGPKCPSTSFMDVLSSFLED